MTAEKVFEKHWRFKTDFPIDDVIKLNMQYCVEAMQEYAEMKCKQLLEIVVENASAQLEYDCCIIDKDSILNCVDIESFCK